MSKFEYYREVYSEESAQFHIDSAMKNLSKAQTKIFDALAEFAKTAGFELTLDDDERSELANELARVSDALDDVLFSHIEDEQLPRVDLESRLLTAMGVKS